MQLIEDASDHGLDPADYNIDQLHRILSERSSIPSAEIKAEADIMLTESLHEILDAPSTAQSSLIYPRQKDFNPVF